MKGLRNYINSIKPNFVGEGKYSKWFPLFDAVENFVFSTQTKTSNPDKLNIALGKAYTLKECLEFDRSAVWTEQGGALTNVSNEVAKNVLIQLTNE